MKYFDTPKEGEEKEFLSLADVMQKTGYTEGYLGLLIERKMLKAKRMGKTWYVKEAWLGKFMAEYGNDETKNRLTEEIDSIECEVTEKKRSSGKLRLLLTATSSMAAIVAFVVGNFVLENPSRDNKKALAQFVGDSQFITNGNASAERVLGEETKIAEPVGAYASEHYQIKEIKFGGDLAGLSGDEERLTLEVMDVRSETYLSKKQDEVKAVVVWKTNKPAVSEIIYAKNGGVEQVVKESGYGYTHGVVLSKLEQATAYTYAIKSKDRWGNEMVSDRFGIYAGSRPVSVFDMISKAMDEVFGWALKK